MAHTSKDGKWPDGVSVSVHSSAAVRFAKPRAVVTARLVGIPPTTIQKYEPRATRGLPSHTPLEQGFIFHRGSANNRCCSRVCGVSEMSVNALASKEESRRTEPSVHFLRAAVNCACVVGTVRLLKLSPAINPHRSWGFIAGLREKWIAEKLTSGTGLTN
ncbi:hypothetical protein AVEN_68615-1 [Araneus ventricosus]|uniref:Uncharacterized protein n=1 Tax=Araneus ventricosus TaxID=182803 RepID=A0A4Y2VN97_ARAVE|nr:hypothetical protein AVEN_68615-1 [Araneus ventricosus]